MDPCTISVFLNYAREDQAAVTSLYKKLKRRSWIDPWLDEEKILPGQDWNYEIRKAIGSADAFIACLSQKSVNKIGVVQAEIREAEKQQERRPFGWTFIIPVLLDDCQVPMNIGRYNWVKIGGPGGIDKLLKSLEQIHQTKCGT